MCVCVCVWRRAVGRRAGSRRQIDRSERSSHWAASVGRSRWIQATRARASGGVSFVTQVGDGRRSPPRVVTQCHGVRVLWCHGVTVTAGRQTLLWIRTCEYAALADSDLMKIMESYYRIGTVAMMGSPLMAAVEALACVNAHDVPHWWI